ncbi:beta-galactosidase [Paenibacillus oryzisoli]|uniref:beta-galactosidase n=1 Tax=Paenibacillus oryzisoli TaxID=1850517 RepID=UPI003D2D2F42
MHTFPYGAVLKIQREFSLADIYQKMEAMKRCGMNTVVVWPAVFWWENRAHAHYPFQTGIAILEHAEQLGMKVIMELAGQITSLEYAPDFLMKDDYYAVKQDGSLKNDARVFDCLNYNHPEIKQLVKQNFTAAAGAYKGFSALYGYDILNETMFTSYDRYTLQLFRQWLETKYGTIERLNEVWDRAYFGWHQVEFTSWLWPSVMPFVDWQQFRKANVGMILSEWRGYVKAVDPDRPTIADNIHSMVASDQFYDRPHDDWNVAEHVDEFGISFYPKENVAGMPHYKRWETFVGAHSATRTGRFWISEMQSHHRNMFNPGSTVLPHELKWWVLEAISHGAKGMVFWKWDPFIKGNQTSGRGLVDAKGAVTPRAEAAAELAGILKEHAAEFMTYEPEQPHAAIVYDKLTHDFTKVFTNAVPEETNLYIDSIAGLYECLWELNIPVKFITPEDVKSGKANAFRVLFLSNQIVMDKEFAAALAHFAEQGGTVIADGKFGEIREDGILHEDLPGGALNPLLGYRTIDIDPLQLAITLQEAGTNEAGGLPGFFERKLLQVESEHVEVWGRYADDAPAVLASPVGQGRMIYLSTLLWYGYHKKPDPDILRFLQGLDAELGLSLHASSDPRLRLCTLRGEDGLLLFVFNYHDEPIASDLVVNGVDAPAAEVAELVRRSAVDAVCEDNRLLLKAAIPSKATAIYHVSWGNKR